MARHQGRKREPS